MTQNPADLDYKGLSNAGTWFIGKLQTERDKMRVLEGLETAIAQAGSSKQVDFDKIISGLSSRVFLMHNVHKDKPVIYHTRWAMSYLRGPMTRPQVKELMAERKASFQSTSAFQKSNTIKGEKNTQSNAPSIDPAVEQKYLTVWKSGSEAKSELKANEISLEYHPSVIAKGGVRFYDGRLGIDRVKKFSWLAESPDDFGRIGWPNAKKIDNIEKKLLDRAEHVAGTKVNYMDVPESMSSSKAWKSIEKDLADFLYAEEKLILKNHLKLKVTQEPQESEESFQMRLQHTIKEQRDAELDKIEEKYEIKLDRIEDKIRKEERDLAEAETNQSSRKTAEWVNAAETLFSVFVKGRSRSFGTVATKRRMVRRASEKVAASKEDLAELEEDYREMEEELKEDLELIREKWEDVLTDVTEKVVSPRRTDIKISYTALAWHPYWVSGNGDMVSAV